MSSRRRKSRNNCLCYCDASPNSPRQMDCWIVRDRLLYGFYELEVPGHRARSWTCRGAVPASRLSGVSHLGETPTTLASRFCSYRSRLVLYWIGASSRAYQRAAHAVSALQRKNVPPDERRVLPKARPGSMRARPAYWCLPREARGVLRQYPRQRLSPRAGAVSGGGCQRSGIRAVSRRQKP